jgi:hypothetical protein
MFTFVVPNTNTTACTINIDGLGAKSITRDGSTALVAGDLVANSEVTVIYDGTRFQVLNSNSKTNWTVSNALTLSAGTANGVAYLNGSKALTTGSALVFDGTNLGLGVTPSAWVASWKAIQGNSGSFGVASGGNGMYVLSNAYYNTSGSPIYTSSSYATMYQQINGAHLFHTAPSGTAGNAISFTQAMTLDASSNLDIVGNFTLQNRGALRSSTNGVMQVSADTTNAYAGSYIMFDVDGSERARIDTSGNLLVGTTSLTQIWSAASTRINVKGNAANNAAEFIAESNNGTRKVSFFASGTTDVAGVWLPAGAIDMVFGTNNAERARITSGGFSRFSNDGTYISSTGNWHEMRSDQSSQVITYFSNKNASSPFGIEVDYTAIDPNGTSNSFLTCYGTTTLRAGIRSNGGLANFQANDVNLSDERVKTDIKPVGSYWDKIKAIEIVAFKYKDQTHNDDNIGVIAQQVEAVAPEFIDVDGFDEKNIPDDGVPLKTVYTTDMYHAAIKALQEAMARIEKLEAEVAALKGA